MIIYKKGNIFEAQVDAIVNPVNRIGVMGKGLALTFKELYPENFLLYKRACKELKVRMGKMFVTRPDEGCVLWIINFPTKRHWRDPSKMEWIIEGLKDLKKVIIENKISSIAIPPIGCGLGGLDWNEVLKEIEIFSHGLEDVGIHVYQPMETPKIEP